MQYVAAEKPNGLWPAPQTKKNKERGGEAIGGKSEASSNPSTAIAVLDAHLAKHPYLVGDKLTLADFSVAATSPWPVEAQAQEPPLVCAHRRAAGLAADATEDVAGA